jgi:hypothetical protein
LTNHFLLGDRGEGRRFLLGGRTVLLGEKFGSDVKEAREILLRSLALLDSCIRAQVSFKSQTKNLNNDLLTN